MQPFTRNYEDHSTEAGFQFTFDCDICGDGYKTQFVTSRTNKKAGFLRGLGKAAAIGGSMLGSNLGHNLSQGADAYSSRFDGMSAEWHKEHESAFALAQNEAKGHFMRCPRCRKYVCENDWNGQEGLCIEDAPRESIEVAAAKAEKLVKDIKEKAGDTAVFTGKIESRQTVCPQCGKPAIQGKFCGNCGASLSLIKCPKCGAQSSAGTSFCSECGSKMT
jgi:hypothetical protein